MERTEGGHAMKKSFNRKSLLVAASLVGAVCLLPAVSMAQVSGVCSNCHTMHNSQDNAGALLPDGTNQASPQRALTKGGCVGCHTVAGSTGNSGTTIPYIKHTLAPNYMTDDGAGTDTSETLAGGDFYWVSQAGGDAKGHNVYLVTTEDGTLGSTPPGFDASLNAAYDNGQRLTCAGTNGCHGDGLDSNSAATADDFADISGAHHGADAAIDGSTESKSFRFLKGILGNEDSDWEYQATASAHNQYKGVDRSGSSDATTAAGSISTLCAKCHGVFHQGAGNISSADDMSSPWVRHPTDFDMYTVVDKEYGAYGGGAIGTGGGSYVVAAPLASADVSAVKTTVMSAADESIVTCISCHRAHGSPYNDLLRWDYSAMDAHNAGAAADTGCFICHTTKDT